MNNEDYERCPKCSKKTLTVELLANGGLCSECWEDLPDDEEQTVIEKDIRVMLPEIHPKVWSITLRKDAKGIIIDDDYDIIAVNDTSDASEFEEYIINLETHFDEIWSFIKSMKDVK